MIIPRDVFQVRCFLLLALVLSTSCLTNPSGPPAQEPTTITLSTYRIVFTAVNDHERIDATVLDQDSRVIADATVNWRSADNSVARVSDRGVVTAAGAGTTQITVSSGYATATATVSVEQAADSIEITPSSIRMTHVGQTGQFTAVVYDANTRPIPGAAVVWSSSNPEIATVDANGLVTAVSRGSALITASSGGVSTSRPVHVEIAPEPVYIRLNISEATLAAAGQSLQLDAQVYDSGGQAIPGAAVTWSSSHPEVATVDAAGLVIAVSNGTTRITATSGDASAHALVHVVIEGTEPPAPPEPPDPSPPEPPEPPPPPPEPPPPPPPDPSSDRDALIAFYHATGGPNWRNRTNWLSDAPIGEWFGVATDNGVKVIGLILLDNNLTGTIPPEIGQLRNLRLLDLTSNRLSGPIPPEIGQLRSLVNLIILNNRLSGEIPPEIGQLENLIELLLDSNRLSGSIPSEIGNLKSLITLWLSNNQLSGAIPREIGNLQSLSFLSIGNNQLSGAIPRELWNLKSLTGLLLNHNGLTGEIPAGIGDLKALDRVWLNRNKLTGSIPPEIGNINTLTSLNLGQNQFSGGISPEFGRLSNLEELYLNTNNDLGGPLPMQLTSLSSLRDLQLNGTGLCVPSNDAFKAWLAGIEYKTGITFCEDGPEPPASLEPSADRDALIEFYHATDGPNWTNNTNWLSDKPLGEWHGVFMDRDGRVGALSLVRNGLEGSLPPMLEKLDRLQHLDLSQNRFKGSIPEEIGNLGYLTDSNLGYNVLTGSIPAELGQLDKLRELYLGDNNLSGSLPPEIGKLRSLTQLWISFTRLSGPIPPEIGMLANLEVLVLTRNLFSGSIPPEIGKLSALRYLKLHGNQLSGVIPPETGRLQSLEDLDLTHNNLTGSIPPEIGSLTRLKSLSIGTSSLTGPIPPEIGNLTSLVGLNIAWSGVTGPIPPEIGMLTNLRNVDLQNTPALAGPLPHELLNVPLDHLWLLNSQLCVPSDDAFRTWLRDIQTTNGITFCRE